MATEMAWLWLITALQRVAGPVCVHTESRLQQRRPSCTCRVGLAEAGGSAVGTVLPGTATAWGTPSDLPAKTKALGGPHVGAGTVSPPSAGPRGHVVWKGRTVCPKPLPCPVTLEVFWNYPSLGPFRGDVPRI